MLLQLLLLVAAVAASLANELPSNLTQLDANEIPQRYDEAQLWRIYNISEAMQKRVPVGQMLEQKFGGNIWKENSKFLDISIARDQLKAARSFLSAHRLDPQILSHNIQSMIDEELLEGIQSSSFGHGRRTSKWIATYTITNGISMESLIHRKGRQEQHALEGLSRSGDHI